jgi:hypothetical protein
MQNRELASSPKYPRKLSFGTAPGNPPRTIPIDFMHRGYERRNLAEPPARMWFLGEEHIPYHLCSAYSGFHRILAIVLQATLKLRTQRRSAKQGFEPELLRNLCVCA